MKLSIEAQISACEERLKQAMLTSDVSELDALLAPELIFTNHLGQMMTKRDDLEAHQSGTLSIDKITLSDQTIKVYGDVAVVLVQAHILGRFAGIVSESDFRFTRVWCKTSPGGSWQVMIGHSSLVMNSPIL